MKLMAAIALCLSCTVVEERIYDVDEGCGPIPLYPGVLPLDITCNDRQGFPIADGMMYSHDDYRALIAWRWDVEAWITCRGTGDQ